MHCIICVCVKWAQCLYISYVSYDVCEEQSRPDVYI